MKRLFALLFLSLSCSAAPAPKAEVVPAPSASAASLPPDPEPWRNQRPAPGPAAQLHFPSPEQVKLGSGLTVLVVKKPVPVASISLVFRHGSAACPPGKSGLAALTARMLTEGTRAHPGVKLAEEVERLGTTLDEDVGRDTTSLALSALTSDVDRAIALLGEVVEQPAFAKADFERVQKEWLDGLRAERQAPARLAALAAIGTLLGKPHGSSASGSLTDVAKLTVQDIVEFHGKAYGAGDAALVVVGDVDLPRVQQSAEKAFRKLGKGATSLEQPFTPPAPTPARQVLLVDRPGAVQSALALAQRLPKRADAGYEQRALLLTLFGGLFTSRLNLNLREEHAYTYGAGAQNLATLHWGAMYIATSVRSDVTAQALSEALKELSLLKNPKLGKPIKSEELVRARADLVQSVGSRLEYGARVGSTLTELWLHRLPFDYYARYQQVLGAETPESLTRAAELIDPDQLVIVVVGDRQTVEPPLSKLGFHVVPAPAELLD